jgi:hypothetical protein
MPMKPVVVHHVVVLFGTKFEMTAAAAKKRNPTRPMMRVLGG